MINTLSEAKNACRQVRELSKTHGYINIPIDVLNSLQSLDCVSRCIWLVLYKLGYFYDGAATITLQDLADDLLVSRSTVESKLKRLVSAGYIIKQNNFNPKNHQFIASTFFAVLPTDEFEKISDLPTRRECFDNVGRFITEGHQIAPQIEGPTDDIQNNQAQSESREIEAKISSLKQSGVIGISAKAELLMLKAKLKSMNDRSEKNLHQNISTSSPDKKGRSPNSCETYNNNQITDIKNNNMPNNAVKPRDICSSASQRYKNAPVTIPLKVMTKIRMAVHEAKCLALPDQVIAEGEFAVARCFTGNTIEHAANVFCKLLREGRWTTPIPMRLRNN